MSRIAEPRPVPATRTAWRTLGHGVAVAADAWTDEAAAVLPSNALALVADLHRAFEDDRRRLLEDRARRQADWDAGACPGPEAHDPAVAEDWRVAPIPADLRRRRVEITGPVNQKRMVIRMLSRDHQGARADTAMLDFEDAMCPTWANVVDGLHNVIGVARGELASAKEDDDGALVDALRLDPSDMALPMIRVRGLHLEEAHVTVDGRPVAAGLFDLALCLFHTARRLRDRGRTPTYYVPKCEHRLEARWWNRLFGAAQAAIGLPPGTLRATFLIETLPAALQIEEILYEIRDHAAALNVGRWDKIFSDIKVLMHHPDRVLADRATIDMSRPWMRDYARRLIEVCHRRGALAIGGMAAFTPGRDAALRREQTAKVAADKRQEAALGHDGCWVSHPYFIATALAAFPRDNQLDVRHRDLPERPDLLPRGGGPRTLAGLRTNLRVTIAYLEGWRRGVGCVAWDDLMEDLATLEISRAQTWQWLRHGVVLDDGPRVTTDLVARVLDEELDRIRAEVPAARFAAFAAARAEAGALFTQRAFAPFLETARRDAGRETATIPQPTEGRA